MSRVYDSLKVVAHTLQRGKGNIVPLVRVKGALSLNDEMEELERILADRLGRLKAAVKEGEAVVADETQHAKQLIVSLRVNNAALEAKLTETEDSLTAKIHDLQNDVKKKEEALESRGNEVNDLKSKIRLSVPSISARVSRQRSLRWRPSLGTQRRSSVNKSRPSKGWKKT